MLKNKFKIIHIASEIDPFSKTGGLADVTRSLPKAQKRLGHDVCAVSYTHLTLPTTPYV